MNIYQNHILDKYQNPVHQGEPDKYDSKHYLANTSCGDEVTMYISFRDDIVESIHFSGEGCTISMASAEILADKLIGLEIEEVKKLTWEDMENILQIPLTVNRIKCAHLPLAAIQKAIDDYYEKKAG